MGQLTNQFVSQSYQGLLNLANSNTGFTENLQTITDGLGGGSPLQISKTQVNISGSLTVNGQPISVDTGSLVTTSSFNAFTSSIDARVDALEVETGSLQNQINEKLNSSSFNSYTSSNDSKVNDLISKTGSYVTEAESGSFMITGSVAGDTLTFTKGNGSQFSLKVETGSLPSGVVSGSQQITDLGFATTSSVNTKLDSSSFNSYTSSNDGKVNSLISKTGSYATTGSNDFQGNQTIFGDLNLNGNTYLNDDTYLVTKIKDAFQDGNNLLISSSGLIKAKNLNVDTSINSTGSNYFNGQQNVNGTVNVTGSLNVTGELTALSASITYLKTIYQTSSIVFSSGSNILGDEASDVQTLNGTVNIPLGNVNVTGAIRTSGEIRTDDNVVIGDTLLVNNISNPATSGDITINPNSPFKVILDGNTEVTGTLKVTGGITGNLTGTSSYATQALSASYAPQTALPSGLVSGSSQISYTGITDVPSGIISGSVQIEGLGFATTSSLTTLSSSIAVTDLAQDGRLGSLESATSSYITSAQTSSMSVASASYATNALSASYAPSNPLPSGIISGSSQISDLGFATTGSNTFVGDEIINGTLSVTGQTTLSGLDYPIADGLPLQFMQTDGAGNLSFAEPSVTAISENMRNGEATTILKGTPVYVSGSQGATPIVYRADASDPNKMPAIYIANADIPSNNNGSGLLLGLIRGIDTTGYPAGTEVYVAPGGGWSPTRPTGSAAVQLLGIVTKEGNGGAGVILNAGEATLPNLASDNLWLGNVNGVPTQVDKDTLGFATTSSLETLSGSIAVTDLAQDNRLNSIEGKTGSFITSAQTSSMSVASASYATNALSASYAPSNPLPSGLVSGSSQISYTGITDVPSGIVSGSSQVSFTGITDVPSGLISSSVQIDDLGYAITGSNDFFGTQTIQGLMGKTTDNGGDMFVVNNAASKQAGINVDGVYSLNLTNYDYLQQATDLVGAGFDQWNGPGFGVFDPSFNYRSIIGFESVSNWVDGKPHFLTGLASKSDVIVTGSLIATTNLVSKYSSGDEGGEIQLALPQTSTTLTGSITIDVNGNRVRIFETGGTNRGGFFDIAGLAPSVGTNLGAGGGSVPSGTVSGSSQIIYSGITGIPSGIVSGSSQVSYTGLSGIPSGIISGSSQIASLGYAITGSNTFNGSQIITGSLSGNVGALSITSNTASMDTNTGNFFTLSLPDAATHILPTNIKPGQTINVKVIGGTTSTVTFPTSVKQPSGSAYVPTVSGTDILTFVSFDGTDIYMANVKKLI